MQLWSRPESKSYLAWMWRVVLDTNVLVSAIITPGNQPPAKIVAALMNVEYLAVVSKPVLAEYLRVLNYPKVLKAGRINVSDTIRFVDLVFEGAELVKIPKDKRREISNLRDPNDLDFLLTAKFGQADYLVSGDKDLLVLESYGQTKIISPAEFLKILK